MPDSECDITRNKVEDTLNNIQALQTFMRFVMENTSDDELILLKGEIITGLYMLGSEVGQARHHIDRQTGIIEPRLQDPEHAPA